MSIWAEPCARKFRSQRVHWPAAGFGRLALRDDIVQCSPPMKTFLRQSDGGPIELGRFFLAEFLRNPRAVGSVLPSSSTLAEMMVDSLPERLPGTIVELGPGTGSFTSLVAERLAGDARYVGVELNVNFCELLRQRFADESGRMRFACGSAERLGDYLRSLGIDGADYVISGLPLILMPRPVIGRIVDEVRGALEAKGVFRTFSYVHSYNLPNAVYLRQMLRAQFESFAVETPVWKNFPPALVYTATR